MTRVKRLEAGGSIDRPNGPVIGPKILVAVQALREEIGTQTVFNRYFKPGSLGVKGEPPCKRGLWPLLRV